MADIFPLFLKKLGIEENFCLKWLRAFFRLYENYSAEQPGQQHYCSSLEYHVTRKDSCIFQKEAFEDPSSQK